MSCSIVVRAPRITKDGVTVAKEIELEDSSRIWARRWCARSRKPSDYAGDGTTTATVSRTPSTRRRQSVPPAPPDGSQARH